MHRPFSAFRPRLFTVLLGFTLAAAGCSSPDPRFSDRERGYYFRKTDDFGGGSNAAQRAAADSVSYWDGDGVPGAPRIEIRLGEQRAYFYKGEQLVGVSQVSSGKEGHNTPPGKYKVIQKDKDHRSTLYGDYVDPATQQVVKKDVAVNTDPKPPGSVFLGAPMPYFLRVVGGVGMHAGYLPGVPASHGCIRMPAFMAENFFYNVPTGAPVTIVN